MKTVHVLWLLLICVAMASKICYGFRYAWRPDTKVFPYQQFPEQAKVDNGDNDGRIIPEYFDSGNGTLDATRCIESWLGNMRCDKQNNQAKCGYDKGDCCLKTCLDNCKLRDYTDAQCPCRNYKLDCKDPNAPCFKCSKENAICKPQATCLIGPRTDPSYHIIRLLEVCMVRPESMGNKRTINKFCGKDPTYSIVHDNTPGLHFLGCGLTDDDCTSLPCCDDALRY